MKWVRVRLDGAGGAALPEGTLQSTYLSAMDFEPVERRLRVLPDGVVEIMADDAQYMVHARLTLPHYGTIWAVADNLGRGYTGDFVDFVTEAARSYLQYAQEHAEGISLSTDAKTHFAAAQEYLHLADRGQRTGENRLLALGHAVYAAEAVLFEKSAAAIRANPRPGLKLGCNFFRYTTPGARYAKFFEKAFDFATLPFYPNRTAPKEDTTDYAFIDRALGFLLDKGITPKGHPLWFGHKEVNPAWLFGLPYADLRKHAARLAKAHVSRYRGKIDVWDAMNEAHDWANCFELDHGQLIDITKTCCDALRDANPQATSVVNVCLPFAENVAGRYVCYGALPERVLSPLAYFRRLLDAQADFDAVGIQLYFPARDMVSIDRMLRVFESLGKPVHITEMGVSSGTRGGASGSDWSQLSLSEGSWHGGWNETTQADWLEQFYTLAAAHPQIQALTWWDFIEPSFSGNGAFLYEDETPKEIYFRLLALKEKLRGV